MDHLDDPIKNASSSDAGSKNTIVVVDPSLIKSDNKKHSSIPKLNLNASTTNLSRYKSDRNNLPVIHTSQGLTDHIKQKVNTHRQKTSRTSIDQKSINDSSNMQRKSNLSEIDIPDNLSDLIEGLVKEKSYSENDIWEFLKHANPTLHKFGKEHDMNIDTMIMYAEFMEKSLEPRAVIEFVKIHHNLNDTTPSDWQIQKYTELKKKNPEHWDNMTLEIFKEVFDQEEGSIHRSALTNTHGTHIGVLEDRVNANHSLIIKQWIALGISAITTLVPLAWALYGQISGANNPTNTSML
jgi:hypothetical protein